MKRWRPIPWIAQINGGDNGLVNMTKVIDEETRMSANPSSVIDNEDYDVWPTLMFQR